MSANPPKPPTRKKKHSAKKADRAPPVDEWSIAGYQKYKNGKYWFHNITDKQWAEKPEAWKKLVAKTIPDYLSCLIMSGMSGNISKERTDNYEIYCKDVNAFLDSR